MAAPPPSPPRLPLEALPEDIQRKILILIPCAADRSAMARASPAWRDVLRHLENQENENPAPLPPPLPWLLLPTELYPGVPHPHRVVCVLSDYGVHRCLAIDPPGARCFGSHDGAWLFLDCGKGGNHARNVRTGLVESLPADLLSEGGVHLDDMIIHAAALSSSPDDATCVAAAIVTYVDNSDWPPQRHRSIAMWRKSWELAREHVPPSAYDIISKKSWIADIVYHNGAFYMLAQSEHVRVCTPETEQPYDDDLFVNWETRHFQPVWVCYDRNLFVRGRYLVVSRGELLLVLRLAPSRNQPTSNFKVYQATAADTTNTYFPATEYPWAWSELDTLGGRMLFVGQGCSRSYETAQYPGLEDAIYFIDDGEYAQEEFDRGLDNGKLSDGRIKKCFPMAQPMTSPAWLLP